MFDTAGGDVTGVQLVAGPLVIAFLVGHGPDQGKPVEHLGCATPVFGQLHSRNGRGDGLRGATVGDSRLGIESLELAGPSRHPEQDHRSTLFLEFVGIDSHDVGESDGAGGQGRGGDSFKNTASGEHVGGHG